MHKIAVFSAVIPAAMALYGFCKPQFGLALNSLYTVLLISVVGFVHKIFPVFKVSTFSSFIIFVLLSAFLGRTFNLYATIPCWDKLLHLLSGIISAQAGKEIYLKLGGSQKGKATLLSSFALLSAFSIAGLWEIWEFASDAILKTNAQNASLDDTMYDIIAGSVGGIIKIFYDILRRKKEL